MTFANNLDPDEAPQNVGLHLRSKLFDIPIIYQQKKWVETMNFLKILKETNIWKNYPACKELNADNKNKQLDLFPIILSLQHQVIPSSLHKCCYNLPRSCLFLHTGYLIRKLLYIKEHVVFSNSFLIFLSNKSQWLLHKYN